MKNTRELYLATLQAEIAPTERVLKAMPAKQAKWKPHERSKSALELASSIFGNESLMTIPFLKTGVVDFEKLKTKKHANFAVVLKDFKAGMRQVLALAKKMTDKQWEEKAEMRMGKIVHWSATKGEMAWGMLLDMIHHRGQLSVYIRPMGGKVPSIYGPSGDSK